MKCDQHLDARGLSCPEPLRLLRNLVRGMPKGSLVKVLATDPTTERDFRHFCQFMGHELVEMDSDGYEGDSSVVQFWIRKAK